MDARPVEARPRLHHATPGLKPRGAALWGHWAQASIIRVFWLEDGEFGELAADKQPHVSGLMRGQSGNFSVERLMDFLTALGQDVEIILADLIKSDKLSGDSRTSAQ